jgi:pimeloyl-ACP methyl ester carboxylesterase
VSFDYSPWASSVDELAARLVDTVEDLLAVTGADKVHLVGHSLGGVIIAQALTRDRLAGRVDLVVRLGSPFGGTRWAGLPVAALVRALRPGSPLLRRLAAAPAPAGVRWLAFASTVDPIVPPDRAVPANRDATLVSTSIPATPGCWCSPTSSRMSSRRRGAPGELPNTAPCSPRDANVVAVGSGRSCLPAPRGGSPRSSLIRAGDQRGDGSAARPVR